MGIGEVSGSQWQTWLVVMLAIFAFIVLLGNVIKTLKEWKKPNDDIVQWRRDVDAKLDSDHRRLKAMEDGNNVLCRGMLALLSHEINGNSTDKLKSAQQEITDYLIER